MADNFLLTVSLRTLDTANDKIALTTLQSMLNQVIISNLGLEDKRKYLRLIMNNLATHVQSASDVTQVAKLVKAINGFLYQY